MVARSESYSIPCVLYYERDSKIHYQDILFQFFPIRVDYILRYA